MKTWLLIVGLLASIHFSIAAKMEVRYFKLNEADATAMEQKHFDAQKRVCALIKLKTVVNNLKITGDIAVIAKTLSSDSLIFLYISPTQTTLTFEAPNFERMEYQIPEQLLSARVYEMEIAVATIQDSKGTIYIKSEPPAQIFVNDELKGTTPRFLSGLKTGSYRIVLRSDGYKDYVNNNIVVEAGKTTDVITTLTPLHGSASSDVATGKSQSQKKKTQHRKQDNGWFGGISFGAAFPASYSANYYNGSSNNENSLKRIFETYPGYTTPAYEQIKEAIGHDFDTTNIGFPKNMAYNVAVNWSIYGGFTFFAKNRVFFSFDYHRLKTNGTLIFYYDLITPGNKDEYYDKSSIHGVEDRFHINLLYSREFKAGEYVNWYILGGFNLNNTVVQKNSITIPYVNNTLNKLEYDIKYKYYDATGTTYTDYVEGGVGYGISAGLGLRLLFNNWFTLDPEVQFFYSKTKLAGYEQFKPGIQLNLRLNLFSTMKTQNSYD